MADCIDALIDANLITTLKTITVANGYNTAIGTVERLRSRLSINNRYPYTLVMQLAPDPLDEYATLKNDKLNYEIWHFDSQNDESETANTEFTYRMRNVHADIIKALKIDPSRGGLAQNTIIPEHYFGFFGMEGEPGVCVRVEIERIIDSTNPYQLA